MTPSRHDSQRRTKSPPTSPLLRHSRHRRPKRNSTTLLAPPRWSAGRRSRTFTLVDESRQWFKSRVGLDSTRNSARFSFCAHAMEHPEPLIVPNAEKDPRFSHNPLVTGDPNIRFYCGMPLRSEGIGPRHASVSSIAPRAPSPPNKCKFSKSSATPSSAASNSAAPSTSSRTYAIPAPGEGPVYVLGDDQTMLREQRKRKKNSGGAGGSRTHEWRFCRPV